MSTYLITGGTGSFGSVMARRLLATDAKEIRIFSRDEKKQEDMRLELSDSRLKFFIGDVRDQNSLTSAMAGADFVFSAAALKQVPVCEFFPWEATLTNVLGAKNVIEVGKIANVKKIVFLSTDKAVYPINAMGITKALMEKVAIAKALEYRDQDGPTICVTRYGNVMASRGSVIPHFANQIRNGESVKITNPNMTRFMMTLDDAVELVLYAFENGKAGQIFVQQSPGASIAVLLEALEGVLGMNAAKKELIGERHGEKLHEYLLSAEEQARAINQGRYFMVPPDDRDLNYYPLVENQLVKEESTNFQTGYGSQNTRQLSVEEMKSLLMKVRF